MQEEQKWIKEKLLEIEKTENKESRIKLKKDVLFHAAKELLEMCLTGLQFENESDRDYMTKFLISDILISDTNKKLQYILFVQKDADAYYQFIERMRSKTESTYRNYFDSKTCIKNGRIYNRILDMYWNKKDEVWQNTTNSWQRFTCFMPFNGRIAKVSN